MAAKGNAKALARLAKELKGLHDKPIESVSMEMVGDDLMKWEGRIAGPPGSFYEGGIFRVVIDVPENYPFNAPHLRILTPIYHSGVSIDKERQAGEVCMESVLGSKGEWVASIKMSAIIHGLIGLLANPSAVLTPLRPSIRLELADKPAEFERQARAMVRQYAQG
jgi:ubiquitin-protein ligase